MIATGVTTPAARQYNAALRLFANFSAITIPKIVVAIKLTAMTSTNHMRKRLLKLPPAFKPCDVWIVDSCANKWERLCSPNVWKMPDTAKNNKSGAKTQPVYK